MLKGLEVNQVLGRRQVQERNGMTDAWCFQKKVTSGHSSGDDLAQSSRHCRCQPLTTRYGPSQTWPSGAQQVNRCFGLSSIDGW